MALLAAAAPFAAARGRPIVPPDECGIIEPITANATHSQADALNATLEGRGIVRYIPYLFLPFTPPYLFPSISSNMSAYSATTKTGSATTPS